MSIFLLGTCALLGAAVGSFVNVIALRYGKRSWVHSRSSCGVCGHVLRWFELMPVLSYVAQRARSRCCKTPLSARYLFVEVLTAIVFVGIAYTTLGAAPYTAESIVLFVLHALVWGTLILVALYDYDTTYIPNEFVYVFALAGLAAYIFEAGEVHLGTITHLIAGPALFLPFYALWRYSDGKWLGLGDGKLAWGMGWYLGLSAGLSAIVLGFWVGALTGILIIAFGIIRAHLEKWSGWQPFAKQRSGLTMKSEVPFGPFLILGTALAYFFDLSPLTLFL